MTPSWLVLLPPVIVLISSFILKNLNLALLAGLITAALIATDFSLINASYLISERIWGQLSDIETIYNYAFLLSIGIIICLMSTTGGAFAFAASITKRLQTKKMVETSSVLLSLSLFIDDYLSNLSGYVMRPISDKFTIARAKLAFLVHTMGGPLVILAPISTWGAMITGQLERSGVSLEANQNLKISADPFLVYLKSLPFIFYSLIMLVALWIIVRRGISYGSMHTHETIAQETGNLFGGKEAIFLPAHEQEIIGSLVDFIVPLSTLIGAVIIGILWFGNFYLFGGTNSILEAFKNNTQTFLVLFWSGILTLIIGFGIALTRKKISTAQFPTIFKQGILLMYSAIIMVFLASTLGIMLRMDLKTGAYLADMLLGSVNIYLLPLMLFVTSCIVGTMIGSAWGTIALMLPIAIPMLVTFTGITAPATLHELPLLFPVLGAIFSGAVFGDHTSTVSSASIMAANSAGCYPIDHVITQLPYAIPAFIGACISFLAASYLSSTTSVWLAGITSCCIGLIPCLAIMLLLNKNK